ncbi:hypothetical protein OKW45_006637 [Paraburkholderia sp. WSM4175]|uniref:hypothetical protein n=1 Tax=Paraburkholderia sp. WSM4175 TaxID=2991072 RepID=UPI003D22E42C
MSVYRHLPKIWANHFFDTGELLLTTLPKCREHEEESRRDGTDGKLSFAILDGQQIMAGLSIAGKSSYLLCTSCSCAEPIQQRFGTDSWIEIIDVQGFAQAVCRAVGSDTRPMFVPCRYLVDKSVTINAASPIADDFAEMCEAVTTGKTENIKQLFYETNARLRARAEAFEHDVYFLKPADPYQIEEEFRFVWTVDAAVSGPKVFDCSEARQFCQPARLAG